MPKRSTMHEKAKFRASFAFHSLLEAERLRAKAARMRIAELLTPGIMGGSIKGEWDRARETLLEEAEWGEMHHFVNICNDDEAMRW